MVRILVHYPYIIYYSVEYRSRECLRKIEVQNMFITKLVNSNVMTTPKFNNVPVNVVVVVTIFNQQ